MRFPRLSPASDRSVLVEFGATIDRAHHEAVVRLATRLLERADPRITNVHPAYASVLVDFDPRHASHAEIAAELEADVTRLGDVALPTPRTHEIPVRYDGADLHEVAKLHDLDVEEVVRLHSEPEYVVYFLGFSPGFPYLGGMSPRLATPRLATPRTCVPAGSVAIGGAQTGIYPLESPGGWRIVGRTETRLFRPEAVPPVLLQMGDRVRFVPVAT